LLDDLWIQCIIFDQSQYVIFCCLLKSYLFRFYVIDMNGLLLPKKFHGTFALYIDLRVDDVFIIFILKIFSAVLYLSYRISFIDVLDRKLHGRFTDIFNYTIVIFFLFFILLDKPILIVFKFIFLLNFLTNIIAFDVQSHIFPNFVYVRVIVIECFFE